MDNEEKSEFTQRPIGETGHNREYSALLEKGYSEDQANRLARQFWTKNTIPTLLILHDELTQRCQLTHEQLVKIATNKGGSCNLHEIQECFDALSTLGFDSKSMVKMVAHDGGSNNLRAVKVFCGELSQLGFNLESIAKMVAHSGGTNNLQAVKDLFDTLSRLGFDSESMVKMVAHSGGSKNLHAVKDCFDELSKLGFNIGSIIKMVAHGGGSKNLHAVKDCFDELSKLGFNTESMVRTVAHDGGSKILHAVKDCFGELSKLGFHSEPIVKMVFSPGGSKNLQAVKDCSTELALLGFDPDSIVRMVANHGSKNLFVIKTHFRVLLEAGLTLDVITNLFKLGKNGFEALETKLRTTPASLELDPSDIQSLLEVLQILEPEGQEGATSLGQIRIGEDDEAQEVLKAQEGDEMEAEGFGGDGQGTLAEPGAMGGARLEAAASVAPIGSRAWSQKYVTAGGIDHKYYGQVPKPAVLPEVPLDGSASAASVKSVVKFRQLAEFSGPGYNKQPLTLDNPYMNLLLYTSGRATVEDLKRWHLTFVLGGRKDKVWFPHSQELSNRTVLVFTQKELDRFAVLADLHNKIDVIQGEYPDSILSDEDICKRLFSMALTDTERDDFDVLFREERENLDNKTKKAEALSDVAVFTSLKEKADLRRLPDNIDVLSYSHINQPWSRIEMTEAETGLVTQRRIAAWQAATVLGVDDFMMLDDNITQIILPGKAGAYAWDDVYVTMSDKLKEDGAPPLLSIATNRPDGRYKVDSFGSKCFMINLNRITSAAVAIYHELRDELAFCIFPPVTNLWGEDYFMQCAVQELLQTRGLCVVSPGEFRLVRSASNKNAAAKTGVVAKELFWDDSPELTPYIQRLKSMGLFERMDGAVQIYNENIKQNIASRMRRAEHAKHANLLDLFAGANGLSDLLSYEPETSAKGIAGLAELLDTEFVLDDGQRYFRDHQKRAMEFFVAQSDALFSESLPNRQLSFDVATGAGKTIIQMVIAIACSNQPEFLAKKIMIVTPRLSLVKQFFASFQQEFKRFPQLACLGFDLNRVAIVSGEESSIRATTLAGNEAAQGQGCILICCEKSMKTLLENKEFCQSEIGVVIADEAHLYNQTCQTVVKVIPDVPLLKFSATPREGDESAARFSYSREEAIRDGVITGYITDLFDFSDVKLPKENTDAKQMKLKLAKEILPAVLAHREHPLAADGERKKLAEMKGIVFCNSSKEVDEIVHHLTQNGFLKVWGVRSGKKDIDRSLHEFSKPGRPGVIVANRMLKEGYDCPELAYVINLKTGFSRSTEEQMLGRAVRPYGKKTGYMIALETHLKDACCYRDDDEGFQLDFLASEDSFVTESGVIKISSELLLGHVKEHIDVSELSDEQQGLFFDGELDALWISNGKARYDGGVKSQADDPAERSLFHAELESLATTLDMIYEEMDWDYFKDFSLAQLRTHAEAERRRCHSKLLDELANASISRGERFDRDSARPLKLEALFEFVLDKRERDDLEPFADEEDLDDWKDAARDAEIAATQYAHQSWKADGFFSDRKRGPDSDKPDGQHKKGRFESF